MRHGCEDLELHERHGLERKLDRQCRGGAVQLDIVLAEVPKFVGKDDRIVLAFGTRFIALTGNEMDIWCGCQCQKPRSELSPSTRTFEQRRWKLLVIQD